MGRSLKKCEEHSMSASPRSKRSIKANIIDEKSFNDVNDLAILEDSKKINAFLDSIRKKGFKRELVPATSKSLKSVLALKTSFPNFSEVIDFVHGHMTLCLMSTPSFFKMPPIALGGEAGVGKTQFCKALADAVCIPFEFNSCSTNNAEFLISGLDKGFNTGSPGIVAKYFQLNDVGNPLFIMDEFEKPSQTPRGNVGGTFHGPFFTLLESSSADQFEDNFLKIRFDTSYINWVMTVNDFEDLPVPIQSRLTYFHIASPSASQLTAIAKSIYKSLTQEYWIKRRIRFSEELSPSVLDALKISNPREIRKALETAITECVKSMYSPQISKRELLEKDLVLTEQFITVTKNEESDKKYFNGIGFMANSL